MNGSKSAIKLKYEVLLEQCKSSMGPGVYGTWCS